MPYRYAHWFILLLLAPMIGVAFWRDYFGVITTAPFAFHAHGITASAWLCLLAIQSWSAHSRNLPLHRASGLAVFAAVPLFAAGGVLAIHSMALKFAAGSHPFYKVMGARLGLLDLIVTPALVAFVAIALVNRRRIAFHAAAMLATALLVLPPVIGRLPIPTIPHLGDGIVIALAAILAWLQPMGRVPFLCVAVLQVVEVFLFETIGRQPSWENAFAALSSVPVLPMAFVAAVATLLILLWAWRKGRKPNRASRETKRAVAAPA